MDKETTKKNERINFVTECLNSDLYSYKEYVEEMIKSEGSVYKFLNKHESSLKEWHEWFLGK